MTEMLQKLTWKDVRKEVRVINPQLSRLIDDLDPDDSYAIYRLECPWGQHLIQDGELCLPNPQGRWVKLGDPSLDPKLADDLFYNLNMPLGMVTKNCQELYINASGRVALWSIMSPGTFFGLWASLHQKEYAPSSHTGKTSNIVAGSRSTLLLSKISDTVSFKRLKREFNLQSIMPDSLADQWSLLLELSQHKNFPTPWTSKVIYFSKKWVKALEDPKWKQFKLYLLEIAWGKTTNLRNQLIVDVAFSCALEEKNLRPNPYLSDTVKHLFSIGLGEYPGYQIAVDDNIIPLSSLQKIFSEIYGLRYYPNFMIPGVLDLNSDNSLYYSLEVPTLMSFSPKARKMINKLEDLREIKHIVRRVLDYLVEDKFNLKGNIAYQLVDKICFDYYHTDDDPQGEIRNKPKELINIDRCLTQQEALKNPSLFCDTSPFLRGCVRISHNNISK